MNYTEHKREFMGSFSVPDHAKTALEHLDAMDCVKAMNYARTIYEMMKNKVSETCPHDLD